MATTTSSARWCSRTTSGLGATRDPKLVEDVARLTAKEVRATGINWAFAPCVAVPRDDRWGRAYEGFGEDPALAAELGEAAVRGLQGSDLKSPLSVLACAKHFVADGGTIYGTGMPDSNQEGGHFPNDQGDVRLSDADLRRIHLPGYITAHQGRRRDDHAVLQQPERREDVGQQEVADRHPEDRARASKGSSSPTTTRSISCPATAPPRSSARSTPGWTW